MSVSFQFLHSLQKLPENTITLMDNAKNHTAAFQEVRTFGKKRSVRTIYFIATQNLSGLYN